jgi:hypothetical protein
VKSRSGVMVRAAFVFVARLFRLNSHAQPSPETLPLLVRGRFRGFGHGFQAKSFDGFGLVSVVSRASRSRQPYIDGIGAQHVFASQIIDAATSQSAVAISVVANKETLLLQVFPQLIASDGLDAGRNFR